MPSRAWVMLEAMQASSVCAPAFARSSLHLHVDAGRDGGAIDEQFSARVHEQIVVAAKNGPHRRVIRDDGENHVRSGGDIAERRAGGGAKSPARARSTAARFTSNSVVT